MQCPNCSAQMRLMQRYDTDIDYCPSCKEVWLDRGWIEDKIAKIQSRFVYVMYYATNTALRRKIVEIETRKET